MWPIILITLVMGALTEACLGRASRQHWQGSLSQPQKSLLKLSVVLTLASLLALMVLQFLHQGALMMLATFLQLVAGAFLMQRGMLRSATDSPLRPGIALVSGPICLTLVLVVFSLYG